MKEKISSIESPGESVRKKRFKEYLYEGIMIFLAVVLGFIAENFRQSLIDNSAKQDYIKGILPWTPTRHNIHKEKS